MTQHHLFCIRAYEHKYGTRCEILVNLRLEFKMKAHKERKITYKKMFFNQIKKKVFFFVRFLSSQLRAKPRKKYTYNVKLWFWASQLMLEIAMLAWVSGLIERKFLKIILNFSVLKNFCGPIQGPTTVSSQNSHKNVQIHSLAIKYNAHNNSYLTQTYATAH